MIMINLKLQLIKQPPLYPLLCKEGKNNSPLSSCVNSENSVSREQYLFMECINCVDAALTQSMHSKRVTNDKEKTKCVEFVIIRLVGKESCFNFMSHKMINSERFYVS